MLFENTQIKIATENASVMQTNKQMRDKLKKLNKWREKNRAENLPVTDTFMTFFSD